MFLRGWPTGPVRGGHACELVPRAPMARRTWIAAALALAVALPLLLNSRRDLRLTSAAGTGATPCGPPGPLGGFSTSVNVDSNGVSAKQQINTPLGGHGVGGWFGGGGEGGRCARKAQLRVSTGLPQRFDGAQPPSSAVTFGWVRHPCERGDGERARQEQARRGGLRA